MSASDALNLGHRALKQLKAVAAFMVHDLHGDLKLAGDASHVTRDLGREGVEPLASLLKQPLHLLVDGVRFFGGRQGLTLIRRHLVPPPFLHERVLQI